jgi:hypothetical protein
MTDGSNMESCNTNLIKYMNINIQDVGMKKQERLLTQ